jgi:hypothetical protein
MYRDIPSALAPLIESNTSMQSMPNQWEQPRLSDGMLNGHSNDPNGMDMRVVQGYPNIQDAQLSESQTNHGSVPEQAPSENDKTNLDLSEYLDPADGALQVNAPNAPFFHNHPTATAKTERSVDSQAGATRWDDPGGWR